VSLVINKLPITLSQHNYTECVKQLHPRHKITELIWRPATPEDNAKLYK
jgi:hypothetical protein